MENYGTVNISQASIASLVQTFSLTGTATAFQVRLSELNLRGTGITDPYLNAIAIPTVSDIYAITNSNYSVEIPGNNGILPPINFTAVSEPGTLFISLADAQGDLLLYDKSNNLVKTVPFVCPELVPEVPLLAGAITD